MVYSVGIFLLLSVAGLIFNLNWLPFQRVNLVSDIVVVKEDSILQVQDVNKDTAQSPPLIIENKPSEDFSLYHRPHFITDFNADTTQSSLHSFAQKINELKAGKKRKIRIAYFGDSMIEGDLMTQTLRKLLQEAFGGSGVGFVPITSTVSKFRQTVSANYSDGWEDENFKSGRADRLFLSGHLFRSEGDWVQMTDNTIRDTSAIIEKSLLCGNAPIPVSILVNNQPFAISPDKNLNRIVMRSDKARGIRLAVANKQLPVYGISFETDSGIFVDNLSFRGITGIEFARVDSGFLRAIGENNPYDLIVFQYGVNLLFRPNDKNFNWYARSVLPVIKKIKNCFPGADLVLVSTADRAFRYGTEYKSAVGIDSLIKIQAMLAYETGSSFYNQYATMGGANSIVNWANQKPSLANQDYVHPNHRGAEILGRFFFEAIMNDYNKYIRSLK